METNTTKKKKSTKVDEMSKEQIIEALIKKRECNAKAQKIVESLLEKSVTEEFLLQCVPEINQSHFEDIIEERSIVHLCGYPLCENSLQQSEIPKQKYRISLKTNKVYDITARKSFCSNKCYKSAMYVKKQMLTSPLWFREYEVIPKFHILPVDSFGSLGQEVELAYVEKIAVKPANEQFTTINDFASASLGDMTESEKDKDIASQLPVITEKHDLHPAEVSSESSLNELEKKDSKKSLIKDIKSTENISYPTTDKAEKQSKVNKISTNIVGDIVEKPEKITDPIIAEIIQNKTQQKPNKTPQKKQYSLIAITIEVEKCLAEWFTLDTLIFLFGEDRVRVMVSDKGEHIKEYLNNYAKSIFYNSNTYDQYQALCRKLNMLELEDRKHDAQTLNKKTKPLPDYSILKEESQKLQLKVKAFFSGETEIRDPQPEANASNNDEVENLTQLPFVDKNAQNALRRKIVCQHLNKVLPDLLRSLGLLTISISSDVRLIVNTFKLKANNIMFKPIQWTLIAIVIIKLLSLREKRLQYLLEQQTAFQHMQLLLLSYKQDGGYLERLIEWLIDINRLLDTNDKQLTVE